MDEELRDFIEKTVGKSVDKAVAKMRCDSEKSTGQERKPGLSPRLIFTLLLASANYRGAKKTTSDVYGTAEGHSRGSGVEETKVGFPVQSAFSEI